MKKAIYIPILFLFAFCLLSLQGYSQITINSQNTLNTPYDLGTYSEAFAERIKVTDKRTTQQINAGTPCEFFVKITLEAACKFNFDFGCLGQDYNYEILVYNSNLSLILNTKTSCEISMTNWGLAKGTSIIQFKVNEKKTVSPYFVFSGNLSGQSPTTTSITLNSQNTIDNPHKLSILNSTYAQKIEIRDTRTAAQISSATPCDLFVELNPENTGTFNFEFSTPNQKFPQQVIIYKCDPTPIQYTSFSSSSGQVSLSNTGIQGGRYILHFKTTASEKVSSYVLYGGKVNKIIPTPDPEPEPNLPPPPISLSSSHNYVHTRTYTTENGSDYLDQIGYFDGLGRPIQTVQAGITPTRQDLISYQEYDSFGRESNSWLPVVMSSNKGAFATLAKIKNNIEGTYSSEEYPYSNPVYEDSPLNRVLEQYGPGEEWHTNKKAVRSAFLTNIAGNDTLNCVYYTVTQASATDTLVTVNRVKNYDSAQLYVIRMEDEDGNTSFEFKDKLGQIVLTRQIIRNGSSKVLHDTYYVYDDFGNLKAVLPPLAADAMKSGSSWNNRTSDIIRNYAYLYVYDIRNRCIAKKLPGTDWMLYVYDRADRLIYTQDGEQRKRNINEWTFAIPDRQNRVVASGICTHNLDYAANPMGAYTPEAYFVNSETSYKGYNVINVGVYMSLKRLHTVNYYDNYDFLGKNSIPNNSGTQYTTKTGYGTWYGKDYTAANKYKNRGLLTGSMTAQMNPDGSISSTFLYSVMYYDERGQLIQTKSNNHLGGIEEEYIAYNFTGQPTKRLHIHSLENNASKQEELYTYRYDHAGRLLETKHKLNTDNPVTLASNEYDELGRLKSSTKNAHADLKTSYSYNIRSWTKSITGNLFSQNLYYNESYGGSTSQYNGNISAMGWKVHDESSTLGYAFSYDNLSRLTKAAYLANGIEHVGYTVQNITYDKHGNIKTLQRYGRRDDWSAGVVDNLTMTYTGNQLLKVEDAIPTISHPESMDFKDHTNGNGMYKYNANGAMYVDTHKGISNIEYNSLNLPQAIVIANNQVNGRIEYLYSATGIKLKTIHRTDPLLQYAPLGGITDFAANQTTVETTDYVGNKIYKDNSLSRILVDGGYYDAEKKLYYFYMTDHLGNNRIVASQNGNPIQKTHYYPFGSSFAVTAGSDVQPYKYNGKELDRMHGLNLYDYSARYYESSTGRFTTVDPLAEMYYSWSPYVYTFNNPLRFTDPTGESPEDNIWSEIKNTLKRFAEEILYSAGLSREQIQSEDPTVREDASWKRIEAAENIETANDALSIVTPVGGVAAVVSNTDQGNVTGALAAVPLAVVDAASGGKGSATIKSAKVANKIGKVAKAGRKSENVSNAVAKSKTSTTIGEKFTKTTKVVPGKGGGQSRAEYVVTKNKEGKTIRTYKDSYDRSNKFQHRKPLRGGPEGRPQ